MEITIAGGGVIDLASKADVDSHHDRIAELLAKPNAHGQRLAASAVPAAGIPTLIDLGSPPMGMIWLPQFVSVAGNDPFLTSGGGISNVSAAIFAGSLPRARALAIGPPVTGLALSDMIQVGLTVPTTVTLPDKAPVYGNEHLYVVLGGSGLVAGAANYWATAFVIELRFDDYALT